MWNQTPVLCFAMLPFILYLTTLPQGASSGTTYFATTSSQLPLFIPSTPLPLIFRLSAGPSASTAIHPTRRRPNQAPNLTICPLPSYAASSFLACLASLLSPTFPPNLAVKSYTGELNLRVLHTDILSISLFDIPLGMC